MFLMFYRKPYLYTKFVAYPIIQKRRINFLNLTNMKRKMKNYIKHGIYIFGISLLLGNCQRPTIIEESKNISNIKIEDGSFNEFQGKETFNQVVKVFSTLKDNPNQGKGNEDVYNFTLDTVNIREIITEYMTTYTFIVKREGQEYGLFENLVMTTDSEQNIKAYLLTYRPDSDTEVISFHNSIIFSGTSKIIELNPAQIVTRSSGCFSVTTMYCNAIGVDSNGVYYGSDHVANALCYTEGNVYQITSLVCIDEGESGPGGGTISNDNANGGGASDVVTSPLTVPCEDGAEGSTATGVTGSTGECIDNEEANEDEDEESCPPGKIKNEDDICVCAAGTIENSDGNCKEDPCKYIKLQIQNPNYTAQANELRAKTGLLKETGYKQNKDGTQVSLNETSDGHSLIIPVDSNTVGYMHTHIDEYNAGDTDGDGIDNMEKPIKILSPADIIKFLQIVKNSTYNGVPTHLVYGTMISSSKTYTLRFTGNTDNIISSNIKPAEFYKKVYKLYIKKKGLEKGFLHFLKDVLNVEDVNLYRIRDNGDIEKKTLKINGKVDTNDCE